MKNSIVEQMDHVSGLDDDGMNALRDVKLDERSTAAPRMQGLAGWVWSLVEGWRGQRAMQQKQLRLVETLSLGGKRQIMLVSCGEESFLIGCGLDSVKVITPVKAELPEHPFSNRGGSC